MLGCRSKNLELTPFDPEIEKTFRKGLRDQKKLNKNLLNMEDNLKNVNESKSLRDLFASITTNPPSCIVLPTTNVTYFELKP